MSGRSKMLLKPSTVLVPLEEVVVTTIRAVIVQLLTATTALRPMPTTAATTTVLGAYFIKSSSESCVAMNQNGLEIRIKLEKLLKFITKNVKIRTVLR